MDRRSVMKPLRCSRQSLLRLVGTSGNATKQTQRDESERLVAFATIPQETVTHSTGFYVVQESLLGPLAAA